MLAEKVSRQGMPDEVPRTWILTTRDRTLSVKQSLRRGGRQKSLGLAAAQVEMFPLTDVDTPSPGGCERDDPYRVAGCPCHAFMTPTSFVVPRGQPTHEPRRHYRRLVS